MATKKRRYAEGGKTEPAKTEPPKKKPNLMLGGLGGLGIIAAQALARGKGPMGLSPLAMLQKEGPEALSPLAMAMKRKKRRPGDPIQPPGATAAPPSPPPSAAGGMKRGGKAKAAPKKFASGGNVSSRGDGVARKGKTKGRYI